MIVQNRIHVRMVVTVWTESAITRANVFHLIMVQTVQTYGIHANHRKKIHVKMEAIV